LNRFKCFLFVPRGLYSKQTAFFAKIECAREFAVAYDRVGSLFYLARVKVSSAICTLQSAGGEDGAAQAPDGAAWEIIGRLIGFELVTFPSSPN